MSRSYEAHGCSGSSERSHGNGSNDMFPSSPVIEPMNALLLEMDPQLLKMMQGWSTLFVLRFVLLI